MRYIRKHFEVLVEESGLLRTMTPSEVWSSEHDSNRAAQATLSYLGIEIDSEFRTVSAFLRSCIESPFGEICLGVETPEGRVWLSPDHASDHICTDKHWYPLYDGSIKEIRDGLRLLNLPIGEPLTASQYFASRNQGELRNIVCIEHKLNANDWVTNSCEQSDSPSSFFRAELFDYQRIGSDWLNAMRQRGVGAILGDGMGLGKTIQIIKVVCDMLSERSDARALIVCPLALVENWCREFAKFSTGINPFVHSGPNRTGDYRKITGPVVITTYDVARVDSTVLDQIEWDLLALDEAQAIKNSDSKRAKAIKAIGKRFGVAVTGTPFENHMTDIWSIIDFCLPGLLGSKAAFLSQFPDEECAAKQLGELISPVMLRRTLDDIPNDLPDMITAPLPMRLPYEAAIEYERRKTVYSNKGALGAFGSLRNDLSVLPGKQGGISKLKYEYLESVLEEIVESAEKIIVFADRNLAIENIRDLVKGICPVYELTGSIPSNSRQGIVDDFSSVDGACVLVCNPTVGGAGLNITAANHIFHFTPSWNPALIDQANARAHRRGQTKRVVVHFPYYAGTVEEYMWNKVESKRILSEAAVIGNKGSDKTDELSLALSYSPLSDI